MGLLVIMTFVGAPLLIVGGPMVIGLAAALTDPPPKL